MCERYIIKDRWIVDTKLNKNIHSIDCYEEKSILDIMNGQDRRIAELEAKEQEYDLALNEIKSKGTCGFCEHLDNQQLKEKDHRIKVLERALELSCILLQDINYQVYNTEADFKSDFISQAEKEIKDEI